MPTVMVAVASALSAFAANLSRSFQIRFTSVPTWEPSAERAWRVRHQPAWALRRRQRRLRRLARRARTGPLGLRRRRLRRRQDTEAGREHDGPPFGKAGVAEAVRALAAIGPDSVSRSAE